MSRWRHYNPNPIGKAGVGDCSVRAISAALGVDWETAYRILVEMGYQLADMPSSNSVIGAVLRDNGFKRYAVSNSCPDCFTAEQFAEDHPEGTYVLAFDGHVACVRDGMILDAWNSSAEYPQFYWKKG